MTILYLTVPQRKSLLCDIVRSKSNLNLQKDATSIYILFIRASSKTTSVIICDGAALVPEIACIFTLPFKANSCAKQPLFSVPTLI